MSDEGRAEPWSRTKKKKSRYDPNPDQVARLEDVNRVWELARDNYTQREIAKILTTERKQSYSQMTVSRLFRLGLQLQAPPGAEEERVLLVQQIEEMVSLIARRIKQGGDDETKLMMAYLRALREKANLLGLNVKRVDHSFSGKKPELRPEIVDFIEHLEDDDDMEEYIESITEDEE